MDRHELRTRVAAEINKQLSHDIQAHAKSERAMALAGPPPAHPPEYGLGVPMSDRQIDSLVEYQGNVRSLQPQVRGGKLNKYERYMLAQPLEYKHFAAKFVEIIDRLVDKNLNYKSFNREMRDVTAKLIEDILQLHGSGGLMSGGLMSGGQVLGGMMLGGFASKRVIELLRYIQDIPDSGLTHSIVRQLTNIILKVDNDQAYLDTLPSIAKRVAAHALKREQGMAADEKETEAALSEAAKMESGKLVEDVMSQAVESAGTGRVPRRVPRRARRSNWWVKFRSAYSKLNKSLPESHQLIGQAALSKAASRKYKELQMEGADAVREYISAVNKTY